MKDETYWGNAAVVRKMASVNGADSPWAMVFDSVLHVDFTFPTKVTSNPVALGAPVNDHAYDEQIQLKLKVVMSNVAPFNVSQGRSLDQMAAAGISTANDPFIVSGQTRSQAALQYLVNLRAQHDLCDVTLGLLVFNNMFLTEIHGIEDEKTAEVLEADLSFVSLMLTRVQTTSYPPRAKGKTSRSSDKAKKRKVEGQTPSVAQQRQAYVARLTSGADGVKFDQATATKIAKNRYPDPPGQSDLVNGGTDP